MSDKVIIISKSKLDTLADTIKSKSGAADNLTLDELVQKVQDIQVGDNGNDVATIKLPYLTANSDNSYFELPQSIIDIRGIEIKYRFTDRPSGESWVCGNWKNNTNTFLLGYYNSMLQFSVSSTAQIRIPFDNGWHVAKIENNRLFIDETQSENEITWSNLSALGNLNIFRSPHTGGCLYKDISYVKITDVSGKTQTYYPYIIENSVAFVSEENRIASNGSFTYPFSNNYYENHKLFWALNTIGFGKSNPKAFAGNKRLYYFPRFMNSKCLEIIDWSGAFSECTNLTEANINTSNGTNFSNIFYNCSKLINVINTGDFSKGLNFTNAFRGCKSLTDETIKNLKFDNITNGFGMFGYGTKITQLPKFNHETITNMGEMFWDSSLSDLGETDLSFPNVTNADYIFGQTQITKVPNLFLPKATSAKGLFQNCSKLITISGLSIPKVMNSARMFQGCSNLESAPVLDLTSAQCISYLFQGCSKIKTVKFSNIPDRNFTEGSIYVFNNCSSLERIERTNNPLCRGNCDNFASGCTSLIEFNQDTSNVTSFYHMFDGDTSLETIKTIDGTASQGFASTFLNCSALKNIEITPSTIKCNISFGDSPLLTDASIQNIIDGLATVTSQQTLTLHTDVKSKLTDEQKSAIASKNWELDIKR